jgi:hypothetical protein
LLPAGAYVVYDRVKYRKWNGYSRALCQQIDSLGQTLKPGEIGTVTLAIEGAEKLLLLSCYATSSFLQPCLSDSPPGVAETLEKYASNDRDDFYWVWMSEGKVVAITPAQVSVGLPGTMSPSCWPIDDRVTFRVQKHADGGTPYPWLELLSN